MNLILIYRLFAFNLIENNGFLISSNQIPATLKKLICSQILGATQQIIEKWKYISKRCILHSPKHQTLKHHKPKKSVKEFLKGAV
jgi:hypothetical protein